MADGRQQKADGGNTGARHGQEVIRLARRHLLAGSLLLVGGCGEGTAQPGAAPTAEPNELVILAAASLTDAFTALAADFPRQPGERGMRVTLAFGGSSQLRTQLEQGAPGDVFASADQTQLDAAARDGLLAGPPAPFAANRLVIVIPSDSRTGVAVLADLARPGLRLVTTPKEVPIGAYTREMLARAAADPRYGAGFDQKVLVNIVSEETNVRQLVAKVQLGEADAAIVYATDVTAKVVQQVRVIDLPEPFNPPVTYPIAVLQRARAPAVARRLVDYVRAPAGQRLLREQGFLPAG